MRVVSANISVISNGWHDAQRERAIAVVAATIFGRRDGNSFGVWPRELSMMPIWQAASERSPPAAAEAAASQSSALSSSRQRRIAGGVPNLLKTRPPKNEECTARARAMPGTQWNAVARRGRSATYRDALQVAHEICDHTKRRRGKLRPGRAMRVPTRWTDEGTVHRRPGAESS